MHAKLTEDEFKSYLKTAIASTELLRADLDALCTLADDYYSCAPREDDQDGYSTFISSQVADLVDADMPSMVRIFLGAGKSVEFMPCNESDKRDAKEAANKTKYIEKLITGTKGYYRTMYSALMGVAQHPVSILRYGLQEKKTVRIKEHHGITAATQILLDEQYRKEFDKVEVLEQEIDEDEMEEGGETLYEVKYRLTKKEDPVPYIRRVHPSRFRISVNATDKNDCRLIGEDIVIRRGELVAMGYKKELVESITSTDLNPGERLDISRDSGEWASELVIGFDGFFRCDFDGDGIIELRKVLIFGDVLLENEEIDHDARGINFAFCSATLLPDNAIGMSRAQRAIPYQDAMTNLSRAMLDNTAQLTRGRSLVNTSSAAGVNVYDLMGDGNIIRYSPEQQPMDPSQVIFPVPVQPVATEALTVIQYLDSQRAQSTGSLMANQGLKADSLHKETATRFKGVDDSAQAKVELMVRTIAEVLIRDLYEGMAYYAQKYKLKALEIKVLGEEITINPGDWMTDHQCGVVVGTGYGDNQKTLETLTGLLQIMGTLQGTGIVDAKKMYNLLVKMAHAGGLTNVSDYLNDPENKEETILAENEQLKLQLQQLQQQLGDQTPLLQVEQMRAKIDVMQMQLDDAFKRDKLQIDTAMKLTELEEKSGKQLNKEVAQNEIIQ